VQPQMETVEPKDSEMTDAPPVSTTVTKPYQSPYATVPVPGQPQYQPLAPQPPAVPVRVSDKPTPDILANPLIRITTGYKLSKPELGADSKPNTTAEGVIFQTTYEEQTAVTQVCWNPNLCCGTWAAAGMGSGLVIVETLVRIEISLDTNSTLKEDG